MKAVERILLATNLAPHSDRAMERAVQLAAQFGADLTVLYAIQPTAGPPASPYDRMTPHGIEAEVRRHLMAVPQAASLAPMVTAVKGGVAEQAAAYAELWKADLMVAGVHRCHLLKEVFAVTTIERISIASPVPLLVVRNKPFGPYGSALVPVDFLDTSRPSVEAAMTLVPEGVVHLLHVFDVPGAVSAITPPSASGFDADFAQLLDGIDVGRRAVGLTVRNGSAIHEIIETANTELPDLIVMGTEGRSGIGRILMGSTAHEVLEHLPSDVLLVRAP